MNFRSNSTGTDVVYLRHTSSAASTGFSSSSAMPSSLADLTRNNIVLTGRWTPAERAEQTAGSAPFSDDDDKRKSEAHWS